jgi:hypothetical protein
MKDYKSEDAFIVVVSEGDELGINEELLKLFSSQRLQMENTSQ